jgi:hypothetical protein
MRKSVGGKRVKGGVALDRQRLAKFEEVDISV